MKRKPGVEIFGRLLQTIVAPLAVAGGCLAFVLIKIPLMILTLNCWLGIGGGALVIVFWPVIYGINVLQGNEVGPFWETELQAFATLVFCGVLYAIILYLQDRFTNLF